jgi:hypothetical protein
VRGYIYNNPKLAYEGDGYWCFDWDNKKPHDYWCVLREMEDDLVLMAPVWFDVMDNLPDDVIDSCPMQLTDGNMNITVGIGRVVHREKSDLTTEVVVFLNPEKAKEACNYLARMLRRG